MIEKTASKDDEGKRFDTIARAAFPALSLGEIFQSIRTGRLKLNGKKTKGNLRVHEGDVLQYYGHYQDKQEKLPALSSFAYAEADIAVIWENEDLLALNKPRGWKVHDGPDSLQAWVCHREGNKASLSFRPGPCHRLDRNTTGVIVFAKTAQGARAFAQKQSEHRFFKVYLGLLTGNLRQISRWVSHLGYQDGQAYEDENGVQALTVARPLAHNQGNTLALFLLGSGRTHQIRAQAAQFGYPLKGDVKYGGGSGGYYLHALLLRDDGTDAIFPTLWAKLPDDAEQIVRRFGLSMQNIKKIAAEMEH